MDDDPHQVWDVWALAAQGARLAGRLDAAVFDRRLADALAMGRAEGAVQYELAFQGEAGGTCEITGRLWARLVACCQRCLEPFELSLDIAPRLLTGGPSPEPRSEEVEEGDVFAEPASLAALIEEELLLALPFSPRHAEADCPARSLSSPGTTAETQRPFARLDKALKAGRERG